VNYNRRLSQAISEGDGISLLVPVDGVEDARAAEDNGAEGIVVTRHLDGLREATTLPVLYFGRDASDGAGADACLLWVERAHNEEGLRDLHTEAEQLGLEPVIGVRDDEELELALEELDPEIVLLAPGEDDDDPLEQVLDLLPDVPAGKLAIAEVQIRSRDDVIALERAGVDAVIVEPADVPRLVGEAAPEV
jgi:indole-3-glycerol phosphate synthase